MSDISGGYYAEGLSKSQNLVVVLVVEAGDLSLIHSQVLGNAPSSCVAFTILCPFGVK